MWKKISALKLKDGRNLEPKGDQMVFDIKAFVIRWNNKIEPIELKVILTRRQANSEAKKKGRQVDRTRSI